MDGIGCIMIDGMYLVVAGGISGFLVLVVFLTLRRMWPVFAYAYSSARLSAMEARFLSVSRIRDVGGQKSVEDAFGLLSGTDYSGMNDIDSRNCEMTFNQYFVGNLMDVGKFLPKMSSPVVNYYLREWETYNVLNAMRIVMNDIEIRKDEICYNFVDVPALGCSRMSEVVFSEDVASAVEKLKGTEYYGIIDEYLRKYPEGGENPAVLDAMLDKHNILRLYEDAERSVVRRGFLRRRKGKERSMNAVDSMVVRNFCGLRADVLNIVVALRLILEKEDADENHEQFVPVGLFMDQDKRDKLGEACDVSGVLGVVAGTPYGEAFKNGFNEFQKNGKIDGIVRRLDDFLVDYVRDMAQGYAFSVAVVIRYMALKRREMLLLRSVFKGIADDVRFEVDDGFRVIAED
ncbi:MAG: V-type ATPase subunit [Candidatus Aenigmarchaeota archaeon]|nr:V-type ATPase subunit [Candidatus Aenigmarchaeota archaeon]